MRVLRTRGPVSARNEDVANVQILLEIANPLRVHPQHLLPLARRHAGGRVVVLGTLDDQLGRPPRGDAVVQTDPFSPQLPLDAKVWGGRGPDPDRPARPMG